MNPCKTPLQRINTLTGLQIESLLISAFQVRSTEDDKIIIIPFKTNVTFFSFYDVPLVYSAISNNLIFVLIISANRRFRHPLSIYSIVKSAK